MDIILIALLTVFAGGVGTLTGFGTSTIMVPVLLLFLPLPETLLLVGIIHWFSDIWKITLFKRGFDWKLIFTFGIAGIVASYLGATIVFSTSESLISQILGGFLLVYVGLLFFRAEFKIPQKPVTAVIGGAFSGFLAGMLGVGGAVRAMFLSAFNLPKATYISTIGAIALFADSTRIITYLVNDVRLDNHLLWGLLFFIPASLLGAAIAKKIVDRIPQTQFRTVIAFCLLLIGIKLLVFPG